MNALPFELIERILASALPPAPFAVETVTSSAVSNNPLACWTNWKERRTTLCAISLVCQDWRGWAQRELWRHILVEDDDEALALLRAAALLERAGRPPAGLTEILRCGCPYYVGRVPMSRLGDVLAALQPPERGTGEGIKELWLRAVVLEGFGWAEHLKNLRTLFCENIRIHAPALAQQSAPSQAPLRLPLLRTLVFVLSTVSTVATPFSNQPFPSLELLDYNNFGKLKRFFDCQPSDFSKLRALMPGRHTPVEYFRATNRPEVDGNVSRDWSRRFIDSSTLMPMGLRTDALLSLWLHADMFRQFDSYAAELPPDIREMTWVVDSVYRDIDRDDLEAVIKNEHFRRILARRSSLGWASDPFRPGIVDISVTSRSFKTDLLVRWPDLSRYLNDLLKERDVSLDLTRSESLQQECPDDYSMDLAFLYDAERVLKSTEFWLSPETIAIVTQQRRELRRCEQMRQAGLDPWVEATTEKM
ncbi:hypothetical protein NBRC10512_005643 [Rhodotorula toruloides]|uniref:RHTO0S15e00760g1_1 n=2 Tax=Rhodotorula toruloides TaxID=5286 RepID=A0A061BKW9_RHOTO|nr:uncharacterized protein RHTO_03272 [Rhodotorula toruloides NP11]EMS25543.1 hypothetical protein RHTO_03272 [Rhodotorula toruloides NP11]CDR47704.1 RHTO0S15e00760g1_1 [Rhodotorula toruloides]